VILAKTCLAPALLEPCLAKITPIYSQAVFEKADRSTIQSVPKTSFNVGGAPYSTLAGCLSFEEGFKEGLCQPPYFAMSESASFGPQLPRGYGIDG
jgi:hypothetical protein